MRGCWTSELNKSSNFWFYVIVEETGWCFFNMFDVYPEFLGRCNPSLPWFLFNSVARNHEQPRNRSLLVCVASHFSPEDSTLIIICRKSKHSLTWSSKVVPTYEARNSAPTWPLTVDQAHRSSDGTEVVADHSTSVVFFRFVGRESKSYYSKANSNRLREHTPGIPKIPIWFRISKP